MNQLEYQDGRLNPPATLAEWQQRRTAALEATQQVMGPLPHPLERCPAAVEVDEEVDCGAYRRFRITYESDPGSRTPAYLLIPQQATALTPRPAVLCLHPTDVEAGPAVVAGLTDRPNRGYAAELAERGFVTLAPTYPLMGGYDLDWAAAGYARATMKAIWDNIRGLDLLDSLPYVHDGTYGVIGHSLGGHNSVYTAAFDTRLGAVISSCGLDSFQDYKGGDVSAWSSRFYMPRMARYATPDIPFDFHDLVAALAPRPCLISAPLNDDNFIWQSVDRVAAAARQVYELYDCGDALTVEHPDCGHDFPEEVRQRAYGLLERVLC